MKVSKKVDYGVRALLDLAQRQGQGPIQSAEIASRQGIPEPFLDHLLTSLRKAGIIRSMRGPQGGHSLARLPSEISLGQVIAALEGSIAPLECVEESSSCALASACVQRQVWQEVAEVTRQVLDSTTLGDLVGRMALVEARPMYHI